IAALRKYTGPIEIDGKALGNAQFLLLETVIGKSTPEDFELVLDFSLSLARDTTIPGKLNVMKSLAADPRALGLTQDFIIENLEIFRGALLETLKRYEGELTRGNPPTLTRQQLALLRMLIERSTGSAVGRIAAFAHKLASSPEGPERSEILLSLLSDPAIIQDTKAFASDALNHKAFIQASLDTIRQFEKEMTNPKTGFAKSSQVVLLKKLLEQSTPQGTARSIDIAHELVKSRGSSSQLYVLKRIAGDQANTTDIVDFIRRPGNLGLLKKAALDTLAQQEKDLVGEDLALSPAQYELLRDLIQEVTSQGAAILLEYVGRFARTAVAADRVDLLRAMIADPLIVASAKDYAGNPRRL
ncbi:MAG TPA: hypothetical protein VJB16_00080, partial [archaeon]|nr:hypothetical protein [archaeon]